MPSMVRMLQRLLPFIPFPSVLLQLGYFDEDGEFEMGEFHAAWVATRDSR